MRNLSEFLVHLLRKSSDLDRTYLSMVRDHCLVCEEAIGQSPLYLKYRLCPHCRFHYSLTARERIELVADEGSFKETNKAIESLYPLAFSSRGTYSTRLSEDQTRTGLTEAAVTGRCTIGGSKTSIVVLDFGFMGGSMGSVVGEKVALAFEAAAKGQSPLLAVVTGGGVRVQEGVLSLMQMAKTVTAANHARQKQVPFIALLSNPATGQAYASFANLADIILAEPGSIIGLAPMKAFREATKRPVPLDAHTAEAHLDRGLLDGIVDREELRDTLSTALDLLGSERNGKASGKQTVKALPPPDEAADVAKVLHIAGERRRPSATEYIKSIVDQFIELRGDRVSGDGSMVVGGMGYLQGERVVVLGQDRLRSFDGKNYHTYPEGLRKARRLIDLASRFNLPVVSLVDTQGAHPGLESEEQGVGNAIATTLSLMAGAKTPTVSVIIGEGGSEAALALSVADSMLMQQYSIYRPVSPGGSFSRLHRGSRPGTQHDTSLVLTAWDCKELGLIEGIVSEPEGGAHNDRDEAARELRVAIARELADLAKVSTGKLLANRAKKLRNMGERTSYSQAAVRREVSLLRRIVARRPRAPGGKKVKVSEQEAAD